MLEGPEKDSTFFVDVRNERAKTFIGQGPSCDIRLTDRHVSRRHACLQVESRGLRFTDLDSTNGSLVNGVITLDAILKGGEFLRFGNTVLRVQQGEAVVVPLPPQTNFGPLFGASVEMRRLYPLLQRLAQSDVPLIIEGETGSGKEVLAEAIHEASSRADRPFVVFDCTTVAPSLIESTLFGHERGAFTGAVTARPGLFEEAHNGTLFIDEIGDLDLPLQARLLRAIDRSQVQRVGSTKWRNVDARILSATRRNLDAEVQAGRFRDDLLFRLGSTRIELPPLRTRIGDVPLLTSMFWQQMGGPSSGPDAQFLARLEAHPWPGNVRELRNVIAHHLAVGELPSSIRKPDPQPQAQPPTPIHVSEANDFIHSQLQESVSYAVGRQRVIDEFGRRFVEYILEKHGGHVGKAAAAAGIGRRYFQMIRGKNRD